ncbi:TonB-dependent receptor [Psychroserpens sp. SPM9]|uniref:TonB-dependent receptor domain-containing protein n=1 Tax=Psychroserpens sp. SPM9 TaxID=2975598 RepID=UPI0021A8670E|nr:TonB-dependent receptor [Psychroserpens sp. SPM9]MDG5492956.1 TonB-dependent receptor plug domain-containing protein [Psychroserpens sp. SPM9]
MIIYIVMMLPFLAFSQEEAKFYISFNGESLENAFLVIEDVYNVRFSYKDELITYKTVRLNKEERTLNELLTALEIQTNLSFEIVASRYIIVNDFESEIPLQELDKIILNTYLTNGISKRKDGAYRINPIGLGILPGLTEPDVLESVQLLPGVVSPNETASGYLVRGGKMDQNRIIWDGINMYHKGHLFGMISPFNPNVTKTVDFINKGTHPRYGERASSVINMSTGTNIENQFKAQLGVNGIYGDAVIEAPIIKDKLGIQASVRSSYTQLYQSYTFNQLADKVFESTKIQRGDNPNNDFSFLDYTLKLNFKLNPNNSMFASVINIDNTLDYTLEDTESNDTFNDRLSIKNSGYGLGWNTTWNSNLSQRTSAYFSEYKLNYNFITSEDGSQTSDFEKRNVIFDSGISTEFEQYINEHHSALLGYQYSLKDVGYAFLNTNDLEFILDEAKTVVQTHSVFGNYEYKNPNLFDVSLGGRFTYFRELEAWRFEPRIRLFKPLFKHVKLQISGEIKHQIISEIDETIISDLALENRLWRLANGNEFPIINSKQISAGFIYTNKGWTIDIDNYYKHLDGITALSLGFLNPEDSRFNLGEQRTYGIDLFVRKRFKGFNSWLSYSFNSSESKYDNLNDETFFVSRSNVRHAFTTALSYKISEFQVALGWRWQTGKPYTKSTNGEDGLEFNDGINTQRLPEYHRLDFSSTYAFKFSKDSKLRAKIGLSIRNVYRTTNLISREYRGNNDFNSEIEVLDRFSIGFTPNFMCRLFW